LQALERVPEKIFVGHIDDQITQSLIEDYKISEIQAIDLYFQSNTYRQLIDKNTALYRKEWTEIYEMLQRELNSKLTKIEDS
jgi:hypothetical protein